MFFTQDTGGKRLDASEVYDIAVTAKQRVVITGLTAAANHNDFSIESPAGTPYITNGTKEVVNQNFGIVTASQFAVRSTGDGAGGVPALYFKMGESVRVTAGAQLYFSYAIEEAY